MSAKKFTQAEIDAMIAQARREGAEQARKEKTAAREARKEAMSREGWTLYDHSPERAERNCLAEGVYVIPNVGVIEASAVMTKRGDTFLPRYRLALNPIFGVNGDTDTDAERLAEGLAHKAKHAATILAALVKAYRANAKGHVYVVRKPKATV